jgi:hypothetical protein
MTEDHPMAGRLPERSAVLSGNETKEGLTPIPAAQTQDAEAAAKPSPAAPLPQVAALPIADIGVLKQRADR